MGLEIHAVATAPFELVSLRERARRLEDAGGAGMLAGDHLFLTAGSTRHPDPIALAAAIGAVTDRLAVGTYVANVGLRHPALLLKHFVQLATLFGGGRVIAGLGAGWHRAEFDALGLAMPDHEKRTRLLGEVAKLAAGAFAGRALSTTTAELTVSNLVLGPQMTRRPRILVGGGSSAVLAVAARYADLADLNAPPRRRAGPALATPRADQARRLLTTVSELHASARSVRTTAARLGRDPERLGLTVLVDELHLCRPGEVAAVEARLCDQAGVLPQPLHQCPYVLVGDQSRIRDLLAERVERLGLTGLVVLAGADAVVRLCAAVPDR